MPDVVVQYDPSWPERFEEEAERIRGALGSIVIEIEQSGSTSRNCSSERAESAKARLSWNRPKAVASLL